VLKLVVFDKCFVLFYKVAIIWLIHYTRFCLGISVAALHLQL